MRARRNSAKDLKEISLLHRPTDRNRLLHKLIAKNPGVHAGDLCRLYCEMCPAKGLKPIAVRTYFDYCGKLVTLGLVETKYAAIPGKVREFGVTA